LTGVLVVVKILTHCEHLAIAGQSNEENQSEFCREIHNLNYSTRLLIGFKIDLGFFGSWGKE
jgi:hypothetical protein